MNKAMILEEILHFRMDLEIVRGVVDERSGGGHCRRQALRNII